MLSRDCLSFLDRVDGPALKAQIQKLSSEIGINPPAQRQKMEILRSAGLSDEEARVFLGVILDEPDEHGNVQTYEP